MAARRDGTSRFLAALGCGLLLAAGAAAAPAEVGAPSGKDAAKLASRSVWALVPDAPGRKRDLRPDLVRGAAVAVGPGTLLASCGAVGGRERVGLVRHSKYRVATVAASDPGRDVCVLRAEDAPLTPVRRHRDLASLRPGEPVFAITGDRETAGGVRVLEGRVATRRDGADPVSGVTADGLPPGELSAVVVDGQGALVGLGAADAASPPPTAGALAVRSAGAALAVLGGEGSEPDRRPALALTTPGGPAPVIEPGERLELTLAPGADGYAYCFYADASGAVSRIFPNRFAPDARVAAGREVAIPGPGARFEIVPERPGTVERVACVAAAADPAPALPALLAGPDLTPLPAPSLEAALAAVRAAAAAGPGAWTAEARIEVAVGGGRQVAAGPGP